MFTRTQEIYDAVYDAQHKDYRAEAARVVRLAGAKKGPRKSLLDVACGTGRHLELWRPWFEVEGVDVDPRMLDIARRRLPGVPLHRGDLRTFDLGRTFEVVTCLFSSIAYVRTLAGLREASRRLAAHVAPGGLLLVEPWFGPKTFHPGRPFMTVSDRPRLKVARQVTTAQRGRLSILDLHYLVSTPSGTRHLRERHEMGLFTDQEMRSALSVSGMTVTHDRKGLTGRGLWLARDPRPVSPGVRSKA